MFDFRVPVESMWCGSCMVSLGVKRGDGSCPGGSTCCCRVCACDAAHVVFSLGGKSGIFSSSVSEVSCCRRVYAARLMCVQPRGRKGITTDVLALYSYEDFCIVCAEARLVTFIFG